MTAFDWDELECPRSTWEFLEGTWPVDPEGVVRLKGQAIAESLSRLLVRAAFADDYYLEDLDDLDLGVITDRRLMLLLAARIKLRRDGRVAADDECDTLVVEQIQRFHEDGKALWDYSSDLHDGADVRRELRALRLGDDEVPDDDRLDRVRLYAEWIRSPSGEPEPDSLRECLVNLGKTLAECGVIQLPGPVEFRSPLALQRANPLRTGVGRWDSVSTADRPDLIDCWVPAGVPILTSALPGDGKSTYLAGMSASLRPGGQFLGLAVGGDVGGVLYLAFEDLYGVRASVDAWERHYGLEAAHVMIPTSHELLAHAQLSDRGFCRNLEDVISSEGLSLVIIDTFAEAVDLQNENNASEITAKMRPVKQLIERTGCTFVFSHHSGKGGGGYRGSTAIAASVRAEHTLASTAPQRLSLKGGKWNAGLRPRGLALRTVSPDGERGRAVIALDTDQAVRRTSDDSLLLERARHLAAESSSGDFHLIDLEPFAESELGWARGRNGRISKLTNGWRDRALRAGVIIEGPRSGWYSHASDGTAARAR